MNFLTLNAQDFAVIGLLIFLEGILSIDNALVIALLARPLPKTQQKKALLYGLVGAFAFRFLAILMASYLMKWVWVKFLGGGYLIFISTKELFFKGKDDPVQQSVRGSFWKTVAIIELTDLAFAVDSILAAVALSPKVEVVIAGGFVGLVLMRFAAGVFIGLLERFPKFEQTAYLLVGLIGSKLIIEGLHLPFIDFHNTSHPSFWSFWILMAICVISGFRPSRKRSPSKKAANRSVA